ncbi:MAG TPA: twin-arginine translocase TatA/TatE family subunit [Phycisphaerales bacterium]|nr:twin-arginine translocase TatA/TatE family subunit [Phycisphaerales bacterium]
MPFNLSGWELLLILGIGLLLFGSRLPSVGKNLGKGIVEFKKGLKGVEDEVERESNRSEPDRRISEDRPYRAPLTSGEDRRVSRADVVEEPIETKPAH